MDITIPITQTLTSSEENFLDNFLKVMYKINPSLHKNLSCMKRVHNLTWMLGWAVYSNAQNISKIKNKLTHHSKTKSVYKINKSSIWLSI